MGLALFGNQWVAATYIGTVGDVVPQTLAGRVNGIAGLADNGATMLAVLYTGIMVGQVRLEAGVSRRGAVSVPRHGEPVPVLRRIEPAVLGRDGGVNSQLQLPTSKAVLQQLSRSKGIVARLSQRVGESLWELEVGRWSWERGESMRLEITRTKGLRNDLLLRLGLRR
jgi:hypothetical protein